MPCKLKYTFKKFDLNLNFGNKIVFLLFLSLFSNTFTVAYFI
jgi:hypothetical protein